MVLLLQINIMSKSTKNGQSKKRGISQTLHLALPPKVINHIKKMAKAEKRSLNFKARELMEFAVYETLGRQCGGEHEAAGTDRQ